MGGVYRVLAVAAALLGLAAAIVALAVPAPAGPEARPASTTTTSTTSSTSTTSTSTPTTSTTSTTVPRPPPPPPTPQPAAALCIGDSVLLGAGPAFQNTLSMCAVLDAAESRQYRQAIDIATVHAAAGGGVLPHTVVVALGNNGYTSAGELEALVAALASARRVVLVTVQLQHQREWQDAVNAELRAAAARHPSQVVIADWEAASNGHPELLGPDGIHISGTPAGALVYAATIVSAL